jgi:hypothetical protein
LAQEAKNKLVRRVQDGKQRCCLWSAPSADDERLCLYEPTESLPYRFRRYNCNFPRRPSRGTDRRDYCPVSGKETFSNYYPGSIAASDIEAFVIDAPDVVYEIQADAAFPVADLFGNFDIVVGTGDTNSGLSRTEIGVSTGATTATLPLKAIDISQDPENSDVGSANTNVMVVINNHLLSAGTVGLA